MKAHHVKMKKKEDEKSLPDLYKEIEDRFKKHGNSTKDLYDDIEKNLGKDVSSNWKTILDAWDILMEERTSPFALESARLTREVAKNRSREGKEVGATPMVCTTMWTKDAREGDHVSVHVNLKWVEQAKANEKVFRNVLNLLKRENNGIGEMSLFDTGMDSSSSVDEIFKKYAKGKMRFGIFTISDFTIKGGFAEIEYWNIAMMSGGGARHSFKINEDGTVKHDRCIATIVS